MLSIATGYSVKYLTDEVATGRENYYTGAVAAGEPPGRWWGAGAEALGLTGLVDADVMAAVYERFLDPRDEHFRTPERWGEVSTLGHTGRKYQTEEELYEQALNAEPDASPERRTELRLDAGQRARKNVAFFDATFSVQKSVTVLHAAFEAQKVQAAQRATTAGERHAEAVRLAGEAEAERAVAEAKARQAAAAATAALSTGDDAGADAWLAEQRAAEDLAGGWAQRHADATTTAAAWLVRRDDAHTEAESWGAHRTAVEDAVWAGNHAGLSYLADHAGYSRIGHHGGRAGRFVDAHDWTVASFFQHDSRDHDPQLHIHNAILNRVEGSDGQWRTLDSRAVHKFRGAAGAVAERTTEAHLSRALGVRFATRPDGKAREIVGVDPEVMAMFSTRRRAITRRTRDLVDAFETKYGREPNALELTSLAREATFATRKAKTHDGETATEQIERWNRKALHAKVSGGLAGVAHSVLDHDTNSSNDTAKADGAGVWSPTAVVETALAAVQQTKAAWTAPDLTRAISDALPDELGDLSGDQITRLLDGLTAIGLELAVPLDAPDPGDATLPDDMRLADGRSSYEPAGGRRYATVEHVHTERVLAQSATARTAPALTGPDAQGFVTALAEQGIELGADQAAAVRGVLTSGAGIESLVGPAGTGKSFVVGTLAKAWQDPGLWGGQQRRVIGLASSQIATTVLEDEGLAARNIARWLSTQHRLAAGGRHPEDTEWQLRAGDLVVVDESAVADTPDLAAIHAHVTNAGAKLLLTGDHRQLAAVGAGGGMELMATAGASYELVEARRFTHEWERDASLRLRDGDKTVLDQYHRNGRLLDAGTVEQAETSAATAWLADTLAGHRSLLIADTNEQAARLSAQLRADLVRLGRVAEDGVPLGLQGTYAGVGDVVQARRNGWNLAGYEGNRRGPINREQYRVVETRDDGGLVVTPTTTDTGAGDGENGVEVGERITLPGAYVAEHVALGYASTVHAAQGLTVDTSHGVITPATGQQALYVQLTRGRHGNTAHVTTVAVPDDAPPGVTNETVHRNPAAVLANTFDTTDTTTDASASAVSEESAQQAGSVQTPAERLAAVAETATAGRTARWLDELVDAGHLTDSERQRIAVEDGAATLNRLLRRAELAGHDPRAVLMDAVVERPLTGARQITNVLHHRITDTVSLDPVGDTYTDWVPTVDRPDYQAHLADLAAQADQRRQLLGEQLADNPPQWAVETLGAPPQERAAREEWQQRAGAVAAHRELTGHTDETTALGAPSKPGQAETYASWRAAWRALGGPDEARDEMEMSDGQLRVRIRAYERERAWGPRYVGHELAGTRQAADTHRRTAELRRAEAAATPDPTERARLDREADQAADLAAVLDQRVAELADADHARAEWWAHTAATRAAHDRAKYELAVRHGGDPAENDRVTAEEWLAAHHEHMRAEDPHRAITEHELTDEITDDEIAKEPDLVPDTSRDATAAHGAEVVDEAGAGVPGTDVLETAVPDVRDQAADEPAPSNEDVVRVPTAAETADTLARTQRALREITDRRAADEHADQQAREDRLAHWHARDEAERADQHAAARADARAAGSVDDAVQDRAPDVPVLDGAGE